MKTSKKHFQYFEKRVRHWIKILNLNNYDLDIVHDFIDIDRWPLAGGCSRNKGARNATIWLGKDWRDQPINNKALNSVALHECLELLLFDLVEMISTRFMDAANIEPERHNIIQTLIKALIRDKK